MFFAERLRHRLRGVIKISQRSIGAECEHRVWVEPWECGEVLDFLFGPFALRNVTRNNHDAARFAFRIRRQTCRGFERLPAPFAITIAQLRRALLTLTPRLVESLPRYGHVMGMNE